jgi:hypothetical protein
VFCDWRASLPTANRVGGISVGELGSDAISGSGSETSFDSGEAASGSRYNSDASFRPRWALLLTSKVPAAKVGTISTSS